MKRDMEHAAPLREEAGGALSIREHLLLSVYWFGLNFQSAALLPIILPTQLLLFVSSANVGGVEQANALGWLVTASGVISLIVPPIVGAISDHTTHPYGRRRPYIAIGSVLLLLGALEMGSAASLPAFIIGVLLFQLGNNAGTAAYQGLIPDRVSPEQRGTASGYMGLMNILGNVVSLILAALLLGQVQLTTASRGTILSGAHVYYWLTGLALFATTLLTLFGVPEEPYTPPLVRRHHPHARRTHRWLALWIEPWRSKNFVWAFLTRGFVMLGLTLFLTFIEYYFADVAHVGNFVQATAAVAVLALVGALLSALTFGILSDRRGRVFLVGFASTLMALAAIPFVIFPGTVPLWPCGMLFGLGYGAYTSVDWALAIDALPSLEAAGKDMGIWTISTNLPSIIAPLLGTAIIDVSGFVGQTSSGYRIIFALAAVFIALGAVCVRFVRPAAHLDVPRATALVAEMPAAPLVPAVPTGSAAVPAVSQAPAAPQAPGGGVSRLWRLALTTRSGKARGFLRLWPVWEWLTLHTFVRVHEIPGSPHQIFAIHFTHFHGREITLPDGTHIAPGDPIGELHFHNHKLLEAMQRPDKWQVLRMMREDLAALAAWTERPDFPSEVRAVFGVTLISRAGPRLGFTIRPRPHTLMAWLDRGFMLGLLMLYTDGGLERLATGKTYMTYPQEAWMSRGELRRRYGRNHSS